MLHLRGARWRVVHVRLPFQPRWRPLILDGTKTTTVRTKRHGGVDDTFEVEGETFRLIAVESMALREARDSVWREEGMDSPEEFEQVWRENHPTRGLREADSVWVHRFERAGAAREAGTT